MMKKEEAQYHIEFAIANNVIMGPNQARYLYECAELPPPDYLIPEALTEEEKEKRYQMGVKLFKSSII